MRKIAFLVSVLALTIIGFSSCCTTRVASETKLRQPKTAELLADLNVQEQKINHTYQTTVNAGTFVKEETLKDNAVYEALKTVGADVLVAPQYKITVTQCIDGITYEVVVTGYPATYTNFRQQPVPEKVELRELKEGAAYVIIRKSADNTEVDVDKQVITAPAKKCRKAHEMGEPDHNAPKPKGDKK